MDKPAKKVEKKPKAGGEKKIKKRKQGGTPSFVNSVNKLRSDDKGKVLISAESGSVKKMSDITTRMLTAILSTASSLAASNGEKTISVHAVKSATLMTSHPTMTDDVKKEAVAHASAVIKKDAPKKSIEFSHARVKALFPAGFRVSKDAPIFLAAVADICMKNLLKDASEATKGDGRQVIKPEDIGSVRKGLKIVGVLPTIE